MIEKWTGERRSRIGRHAAGGTALAALLLLGTACAGTGGSSGVVDTAGLTGTPIKIGLMVDMTGPGGAPYASAAKVFQAWAAETNATGGIGGHPVQVVVNDTRGDSPTAAAAAEELIGDESIAAVVSASVNTDSAVGETLSRSGLPVVGGIGYNPRVWGALKNYFGVTTTFPHVVNMQIASAQRLGAKTLSVVACAEDPSCVAAIPVFEAAAKAAGTTYAGTVKIAASAPNYTAECLDLVRRKADFVQLSIGPSVGVRLVQDCQTQGYKGYFGSSAGGVTAELYDTKGIHLAGALNAFPWWVDDTPVKQYRDAMAARGVDAKDWANPNATAMWATGKLFARALSTAAGQPGDQVTRQTVLAAYGKVSGETVDGLLPEPMTFTADKPGPPVNCFWLYQYKDGAFTGDLKPTCGS
jgi:branched-chain amino acid transport system substrate-binding protein